MQRFEHSKTIRVGLLIHKPIRLAGFESIFEKLPNLTTTHGPLKSLLSEPDISLLVVDMKPQQNSAIDSVQLLTTIRQQRPDIRIILIGQESDDELVMESILAGARAFLDWKVSPLTLDKAITEVVNGEIWARRHVLSKLIDRLMFFAAETSTTHSVAGEKNTTARLTEREQQVVELILQAQSNREIAKQLGIAESTVKSHVGRLMNKVGAKNRVEMSLWALQQVDIDRDAEAALCS